jgi:hypothetical protein
MAFFKLQYVTKDRDRHGNLRFYFRRPGKPKVRLYGLPGSDEFMIAYRAALAESDPSRGKVEKSFEWALRPLLQIGLFSLSWVVRRSGPVVHRGFSAHFPHTEVQLRCRTFPASVLVCDS